jgi:serine/threonine protein kinase
MMHRGYALAASPSARRVFGPYELIAKLGEGGMAEVFLAERRAEGGFRQKVALKTIHPRYRSDAVLLERFVTEARTNARLRHANIPKVINFGTEPAPFIALEYIEGVSLNELMYRLYQWRQQLDVSTAMFIGATVAQALHHAHGLRDEDGTPLGIVHRDVAPKNVLISVDGTPYLVDFGLAQVADNLLETHGAVPVGTYCYMAPEQIAGGHVDARADVFALGILMWEMLTTRQLIPTNDPREVVEVLRAGRFPAPSELNPEVPSDLAEITMQCLRFDPAARPPSCEAVSVPLQRMLHERTPGYGREQLTKTIRWAFPERDFDRHEANAPAEQPEAADRARLAWTAKASDSKPTPVWTWLRSNVRIVVIVAVALVLTSMCSFMSGILISQ